MPKTEDTLDIMAGEIFELYRLIAIARARQPANHHDLSETEFLTLDALAKQEPLSIGEVQKQICVMPAQMSRIVRALEQQGGRAFVACSINPQDRRRIDLTLTKEGKEAYDRFRTNRLISMQAILKVLDSDDREHFMRVLRQIRTAFQDKINQV